MEHASAHIIDTFGRKHDYLRISLTERCNLRCVYCMPEEGVPLRDRAEFMSAEETIAIASEFVRLGVKKIRLTGGEPLIKKNFELILRALGQLPIELALTTNGILIDRYLDAFAESGLKKINVSLDSLNADRFNAIARRGYFETVMRNISLLMQHQFEVRINVVLMRGVNDDEITEFVRWTLREHIDIRFIEFMPFDGNNWDANQKISLREIIDRIEAEFGADQLIKLEDGPNATAKYYRLQGALGRIGIISTVTNPFCDTCNRIRLTADGKIKNCLFSNDETDLLRAYRNGQPIEGLIHSAIAGKKKALGGLGDLSKVNADEIKNRSMISIGG